MAVTTLSQELSHAPSIAENFKKLLDVARRGRSLGLDPCLEPECVVTADVAERVESAVGPPGASKRIRELARQIPREEVAFKIAEEIVLGNIGADAERAADQAIRTALGILDEGVTVAPIQGISSVRIKANPDKTRYLAVYFAGPIRAAGGTEMGLVVVVADFVRQLLRLDRYKATDDEARRFVEEFRLYEREVARFQYKASDAQLVEVIKKIPIEVTGVETDPVEVASFRNLPRIETNRVRGGALRVVSDGLIGRSQKLVKLVEKLGLTGWSWLPALKTSAAEAEATRDFLFMEDVVAGRPIFSLPGMTGGFRLRYGRARTTGFAAIGVHPATMRILGDFIAAGTQLRIEKPGKAGIALPVDSIEPPIVKLRDGSVVRVGSKEEADRASQELESVLFLGDLLISYGDFLENNCLLAPSGFVEEWWAKLVLREVRGKQGSVEETASLLGIDARRLAELMGSPLDKIPSFSEALQISRALGVPLHPRYTYYWDNIGADEFETLRNWLVAFKRAPGENESCDPARLKPILEKMWVPHRVVNGRVVLGEEESSILYTCLGGLDAPTETSFSSGSALEQIRQLSGLQLMPKAPVFIGARMGRPEKADRREMRPTVHCLLPIGLAGGMRRNIVEAASKGRPVAVELVRRRCPNCQEITTNLHCSNCKVEARIEKICPRCGKASPSDQCPGCKIEAVSFDRRPIDIKAVLQKASRNLRLEKIPETIKGVRGLTSHGKVPERLEKGILRARHDLSVFKDGTTRFDSTNAPLTHFVPSEIGTTVGRLRELGYYSDVEGRTLTDESQICQLQIQDIIIPEKCAVYLLKVAAFLDELLQRFYGLPSFYNASSATDLAGHLVVGLSPHTSVGVIGRIIGFSRADVCYAHPLWHAAKRRDCDGDEDSIALALDVLLNFSRAFLPSTIGGLMDAPLLLNVVLNPAEVERQALNVEVTDALPLRFYQEAQRRADAKIITGLVETLGNRIERCGEGIGRLGFTHPVRNINQGNLESSYKRFPSMLEKVAEQLRLAQKIKGVSASDVARRVLSTHLMRDVAGNLRAFATQKFRCVECNAKYRRMPLAGCCTRCGGKISLTVFKGSIEKYLDVARELVKNYSLGKYYEQRLKLLEQEISSLFSEGQEGAKQPVLVDFM